MKVSNRTWEDVTQKMWCTWQDVRIAEFMNVTRQRVSQVRKSLGKKRPTMFHCRRDTVLMRLKEMDTSKLTLTQIAIRADCERQYARAILQGLGKVYKVVDGRREGKYNWARLSDADWDRLSNSEIAELLRVKNAYVVAQRRDRRKWEKLKDNDWLSRTDDDISVSTGASVDVVSKRRKQWEARQERLKRNLERVKALEVVSPC